MSSGGSTRNRKKTDYIFAGTPQAGKESGNMALVAYEDAMCKSHSQASLLWNTNTEVVQAYTYSHSGVEEPGNEASNVQALVQQNSLIAVQFHFSISVVYVHKLNYGSGGRQGRFSMCNDVG